MGQNGNAASVVKLNSALLLTSKGKESNLSERLKDPEYRRKLKSTLWICFALGTLGWLAAQKGPSFLDLLLITDVDVEKGSWYFTAGAAGFIPGSFLAGILLDVFNKKMVLFFSIVGIGAVTSAIPWCDNYWLMATFQALYGVFCGLSHTGANNLTSRLWGNQLKQYMVMVHFFFAFGGVVSPLVTKPFLVPVHANNTQSNDEVTHYIEFVNSTSFPNMTVNTQTSVLYIPFSVSGVLSVLSAIPFLYEWSYERRHLGRVEHKFKQPDYTNECPKVPLCLKLVTITLIGLICGLYFSMENDLTGFLATFTVRQLNWSKQKGAVLTSLLWGTFALGRLSGILTVKLLNSVKMLQVSCLCIMMSYIGLYLGVVFYNEPVIWLFTGMLGISMSFVFPCTLSWTEEDIFCITAKVSSFILIVSSSTSTATPLLVGFMMKEYTSLALIYILFCESILLFAIFVILWFIVKFKIKPINPQAMKRRVTVEFDVHILKEDFVCLTK